ncbi:hypothetical protein BD414DRAFT_150766 [Trametes punicea]|nr:hypothetical protein BD414DRAFT_150766 [Trametes punicea]
MISPSGKCSMNEEILLPALEIKRIHPLPRRLHMHARAISFEGDALIDVDQKPTTPCRPYLAVSYTWDPDPTFMR